MSKKMTLMASRKAIERVLERLLKSGYGVESLSNAGCTADECRGRPCQMCLWGNRASAPDDNISLYMSNIVELKIVGEEDEV